MDNKVYLACYHGKATKRWHRVCDAITKFFTRGKYSHCEIAVHLHGNRYKCYSSSYRDGGVRVKVMVLDPNKWDLLPLDVSAMQVQQYFGATRGASYDLVGALGCVAGLRQHPHKYFCSEWCFNAITRTQDGWRVSPVMLSVMAKALL
ncbi:enoyl-CoA hydratase [Moraxella pluranimalium]|uniref:Enoyl-CoA hydratase n=1 Tax=Moraxella pluranimalium TaxID=470453 RepID=A0A1T0CQM3_9GAMM|nr:enoyl-CoA hydratase [Moraxella pluranimalium]OOS24643.1 enoyl-CoA hydratase [Moraxella pluranimalium]